MQQIIKFVTLNYEIYNSFMEGRVKWFDDKRGYGFITSDDGEDIYVHYTAIVKEGYRTLRHNWRVTFDIVVADKGHKEARNVMPKR